MEPTKIGSNVTSIKTDVHLRFPRSQNHDNYENKIASHVRPQMKSQNFAPLVRVSNSNNNLKFST